MGPGGMEQGEEERVNKCDQRGELLLSRRERGTEGGHDQDKRALFVMPR